EGIHGRIHGRQHRPGDGQGDPLRLRERAKRVDSEDLRDHHERWNRLGRELDREAEWGWSVWCYSLSGGVMVDYTSLDDEICDSIAKYKCHPTNCISLCEFAEQFI